MKDIYSNVLVKASLNIAARTDGTVNGTGVDRNEDGCAFQDALVVIHTGTITDGTHTMEVQDSDDNTTFAAVTDTYLTGAEPAVVAANDNVVYEIRYTGRKRYLRVVAVTTGATTGGIFGATVALSNPRVAPVTRN